MENITTPQQDLEFIFSVISSGGDINLVHGEGTSYFWGKTEEDRRRLRALHIPARFSESEYDTHLSTAGLAGVWFAVRENVPAPL